MKFASKTTCCRRRGTSSVVPEPRRARARPSRRLRGPRRGYRGPRHKNILLRQELPSRRAARSALASPLLEHKKTQSYTHTRTRTHQNTPGTSPTSRDVGRSCTNSLGLVLLSSKKKATLSNPCAQPRVAPAQEMVTIAEAQRTFARGLVTPSPALVFARTTAKVQRWGRLLPAEDRAVAGAALNLLRRALPGDLALRVVTYALARDLSGRRVGISPKFAKNSLRCSGTRPLYAAPDCILKAPHKPWRRRGRGRGRSPERSPARSVTSRLRPADARHGATCAPRSVPRLLQFGYPPRPRRAPKTRTTSSGDCARRRTC